MAMQLGSKGVKSDINVTPFVDIVLVLLIIFMVVTPMLSRALDVNVPPKDTSNTPVVDQAEQLIVSVKGPDHPPKIFLNREEVAGGLDGFRDRITELMKGRRDKVVFFQADGDIVYQDVVDVMDKIREGGAQIGLITDENLDVTQGAAQ